MNAAAPPAGPTGAPPVGAAEPQALAALACEALLDHLQCGDPRAALGRLVAALAARLGAVSVIALDDAGAERWRDSSVVDAPAAAPERRIGLHHEGKEVGALTLASTAAEPPPALLKAAAALVFQSDQARAGGSPADARLERIAAHVPGLLYQFVLKPDMKSRFVFVSPQVKDVIGVDAATATHDATDVFAAIERDDRQALLDSVMASAQDLSVWRNEFRVRRPDGQTRWIHGSASPQREADGSIVWFGYLQDVTERHEIDRVRREAAIAEAANRAKTEFLSKMSHELRTPLNAVLGFAQLMEIDRDEPATASQLRRLGLIRNAGDHLLQMIGDLLDLTRIESGTLSLQLEAVPLRALADELLAMLQALASQSQVTMALHDRSAGAAARADRTRLRQVLLNLLGNAIKYNRAGGRVDLELDAGAGEVLLRVRDSGQGIAKDDLPRLFEPFHRGRHTAGSVEGTGIGLSLSRSLVILMNGRIDVQSTPGVGSTFTVVLPGV